MKDVELQAPYADLVDGLLASTMRAQRELVSAIFEGRSISDVPDHAINRHFSWLGLEIQLGENRHLFDASLGHFPLRTSPVRNKKDIPAEILQCLVARQAPDSTVAGFSDVKLRRQTGRKPKADPNDPDSYVQSRPTRISALVRSSFDNFIGENLIVSMEDEVGGGDEEDPIETPPQRNFIVLRSALSIVYDYLTVPEMPGTRAYALVALRNFLFAQFGIVPDIQASKSSKRPSVFSVKDIGEGLSRINTSIRPRFWSKGEDKLPPEGRFLSDGFLRQFLAMKGLLNFRFTSHQACLEYLDKCVLRPTKTNVSRKAVSSDKGLYQYEFSKSRFLEKLPEAGEIVNEIWGLPVPIRGAETIFRGGLKFTSNQGLVMAIHGGPGTGKTSLALAMGTYLAPFGIRALFITAEENEEDLRNRMTWLVPEEIQRLSVFAEDPGAAVEIQHIGISLRSNANLSVLDGLEEQLRELAQTLKARNQEREKDFKADDFRIPKPCSIIVILDGLQDLFAASNEGEYTTDRAQNARLYPLIGALRELQALVIVTTGLDWFGNKSLDYLVDVAIHLSHESMAEDTVKPHRRLKLSKARHQLASGGTHGFQIAGSKGVRFSPQINYQLDRRTVWKTRLPNVTEVKKVVRLVARWSAFERYAENIEFKKMVPKRDDFYHSPFGPDIFNGSHIFINGQGSGGKAGLALKIAIAPSQPAEAEPPDVAKVARGNKVLIVSFLYPQDYYMNVAKKLRLAYRHEYFNAMPPLARIKVIHLYPGHLRPNDLYNKIEWELDAAELDGEPYTCVVIDGIHNVFLQFPEIEQYTLFWPQIYNSLRSRGVMTITTHTILRAPELINGSGEALRIDDGRSEPLRNALVQKTDFQIEVDPFSPTNVQKETASPGVEDRRKNKLLSDMYMVRTISSIGQAIPKQHVLWDRERLIFIEDPSLPIGGELYDNLSKGKILELFPLK